VSELGVGAAQIMGGKAFHTEGSGIRLHGIEDSLRGHPRAVDATAFVDGPEHGPGRESRARDPNIERRFRPARHGDRAHARPFADQIGDHPAAIALLDVLERAFRFSYTRETSLLRGAGWVCVDWRSNTRAYFGSSCG